MERSRERPWQYGEYYVVIHLQREGMIRCHDKDHGIRLQRDDSPLFRKLDSQK